MSVANTPAQTPNSRDGWITPEEQLYRLASTPVAEKMKLNPALTDSGCRVTDCAVASISRLSGLSSERVPKLADLAFVVLVGHLPSLPAVLTNWYTALKCLNVLPEKIPPLPENIHEIMEGDCPIYSGQKIKDTHFLSLIPEEFGTLNRFESEILKPYGDANYPENENPLRFRYFWDEARQEHTDTPFAPTHWVLMSRDVLPGSRKTPWSHQVSLVDALRHKTLADYKVPTLQEIFTALVIHKVATGESLYQSANDQNGYTHTYTRVKETTQNFRLVVGGSAPSGVFVPSYYAHDSEYLGVAALRKF